MTIDAQKLRQLLEAAETERPWRFDADYGEVCGPDEADCPRGYSPRNPACGSTRGTCAAGSR